MPALRTRTKKALFFRGLVVLFFCLLAKPSFADTEFTISSASASSTYSSSYAASKTIDNNLSTYWRGANSKSYYWLRLDLGKSQPLTQISIWWSKDYSSTNYNIQVSTNGTSWTNLYSALSSAGGTVNPYLKTYSLSGSYRYVRIYINKVKKTYPIIYEVKLYGTLPDTTPPTGTIKINNDNQYTNSTSVTLNLSAQDNTGGSGLSQMQFSNDNTTWSTPEAYTTTKSWNLTSEDGQKTVYVKYNDVAGNWSQAYSDTIILDTVAPTIVITFPQQGAVIEDSQIQLQGTIDGAVFSESRTLAEGENVLTETATDAAGNTSSASITVYFNNTAQIIGPEGGEVSSGDGKVKAIIPPGALSEQKSIQILNVNKDTLQNAAPGGTSLLSVVECKPYGLVFNKPVEIVYTLYQAEIPGTPVELGFYDSVQDKIIPTGQASTVPADGYTVSFSVIHFSTYAALKSLTPQGTPIGGGVEIPLPDMFTGAFSHAIPITVPPGRKGMQPALGLTYRSSNSNSWVGLGFSLNPGYIVRSTRLGPPTYIDTQDTFYFVTDSGATELVHLIDNLYQAKIESGFTKFYKETDDSWRVVGKDGSVLKFGQTTDAKEAFSSGTFAWYLTKATDTNGNYIEFQYTKDQGKSYLSRIDYAGNEIGVSPTNSVEFLLEPRNDISSSYISTSKIAITKRLKEIQVKVNSDLAWRYVLGYEYSQDTNRSLLRTITQYGSDGKSLPAQSLTYQKAK